MSGGAHDTCSGGSVEAEYKRESDILDYVGNINSFQIPSVFIHEGLELLKVSSKSHKRIRLKLDKTDFKFTYQLPKGKNYSFLIDDIRTIYANEDASQYREELNISKEFEKQWLTIIFFYQPKNKLKTLHIIADSVHDYKKLHSLIGSFKTLKNDLLQTFFTDIRDLDDQSKSILTERASSNDKHVKEHLSLNDIFRLTKRLNINLSDQKVKSIFEDVSKDIETSTTGLDFESFKKFVKILYQRKDISLVWNRLVRKKDSLSFNDFKKFILSVQKETIDLSSIERIFKRFEVTNKGVWTEASFRNFLLSKFCNASRKEQDVSYFSHPLNEYFILSSHNTYLIGRQIAGESSVDGYVKALQRGCRCLEIDIWNNPSDSEMEPVVSHGRTFTTAISLSNVLKTIKKYAFQSSPMPLILSLEIHCSPASQVIVISVFKSILGASLISERIESAQDTLPAPIDLMHRILLKVKRTSNSYQDGFDNSGKLISSTSTTTGASLSESNENIIAPIKFSAKLRKQSSTRNVISTLSDLGVYTQGIKFRNFSLPESKSFNHCFSLSENAFNSLLKDQVKTLSLEKHNRRFLMRVYPSKFRLKSSNFNPIKFWASGVQMVATNWQTYDLGQQVNEAMFDVPFGQGFVLKPPDLRRPILKSTQSLLKRNQICTFEIEVISAQQLSRPMNWEGNLNPYVSFEIIGAKSIQWDRESTREHTGIASENGFNPIWQQTFSGRVVFDSEILFLRLVTNTSSSPRDILEPKEIGVSVSNMLSLKQGYRHFPLKDLSGEQLLYTSLFLRISVKKIPV